jgi:hypothetical protein
MKIKFFLKLILAALFAVGVPSLAMAQIGLAQDEDGTDAGPARPVGATTPDSTSLRPQTKGTFSVKYPSQTVTSPAIDNNSWQAALSPCPTTPTNCPDINVDPNSQAYDPPTCPKACSVTQVYQGAVATFKNAICPPGYTQVASYNSQPEYAWSDNPPVKTPSDMSEYYQYNATPGYTCSGNGNSEYWRDSCDASRKWGNYAYTDQLPDANGNVVYIVNIQEDCYTSGSNCASGLRASCSTSGALSRYTYQYQRVICTAPPGNYPTGQYIPGSVACARVTPTWGTH